MPRICSVDPQWKTHQLHVELGAGNLEDMVDDLVEIALGALGPALRGAPADNRCLLRTALRDRLQRYIVAFDLCGLASICQEADRFDPWQDDEGRDGPATRAPGAGGNGRHQEVNGVA